MAEYLSPGVYVEEFNSGPRPIQAAGTAMAAFVGFAPSGPKNQAVLITNWSQFVETFGKIEPGLNVPNPHMDGAYLSHCVYGYFQNGGGRCYVVRIALDDDSSQSNAENQVLTVESESSQAIGSFKIVPKKALSPGEVLEVEVKKELSTNTKVSETRKPSEGASKAVKNASESTKSKAADADQQEPFTLRVRRGGKEEVFRNLHVGGKGNASLATLLKKSTLIEVEEIPSAANLPALQPQEGRYRLTSPTSSLPTRISDSHFRGDVTSRTGVEGLEACDDVTIVCCPDVWSAYERQAMNMDQVIAVQRAMIDHCERMGDRVALLETPRGLNAQQVKEWRQKITSYDSSYAALYYPWIRVSNPDPSVDDDLWLPPTGHVAGIWSRNDAQRGVHKAPANEVVRGALELELQLTQGEQDVLNPIGVNCIRTFTGRGTRVWGARTLSSDPAWRYLNIRRLFNMVEKSIHTDTQWVVFEPNDRMLWAKIRRDITAFLTTLWRDGALFGAAPSEAFYVKCDDELNTPDIRDQGRLIVEIGLAPVKPAEFVVFRITQWAGVEA